MFDILGSIENWFREILFSCIVDNLVSMFTEINSGIGEIAAEVGKTPADWNAGVFSMIRSLSNNVVVPIAGIILTFVLAYELITMLMEKNNFHDFESYTLFRWIFKVFVAVYLVTHTFDITMAIFDLSQYVVQQSAGIISGNATINIGSVLGNAENVAQMLVDMGTGELFGLMIETLLLRLTTPILSLCITLVLIGRMIEIYIFCSIGAIPFATMTNREWGQIGNNYLRGLVALGLQGFFIMVCVAIYTVLVGQIGTASNIHLAIWSCAGYTVLLCFSLFKTGSVSKAIFNAR